MKFLKRSAPSSNPSYLRWDCSVEDDIDITDVTCILAGPTKPSVENKMHGEPLLYSSEEVKAYENYKTMVKFEFPSPKKAKY